MSKKAVTASAGTHRRQPPAQQRAAEQLRELAKPYRFRVQLDIEGFPVISRRYGQSEWFDGEDLAVYTNRPRRFARLWASPGVRRHQTGDTETRADFRAEAPMQIAPASNATRRPTRSLAEAHSLGSY